MQTQLTYRVYELLRGEIPNKDLVVLRTANNLPLVKLHAENAVGVSLEHLGKKKPRQR